MKIAIHAADLDHNRIDGTRVYILNVLKHFGRLSKENLFYVYHGKKFNPLLTPPDFSNYTIKERPAGPLWTQTKFALQIWKDNPDVLWLPMQNIPLVRRKHLKVVVTVHDLAFRYFPQYFPRKDLRKLNILSKIAIEKSNRIIAVSNSTKQDIIRFYPNIPEEKIIVVHHGFDAQLFQGEISQKTTESVLTKFKIQNSKFVLYVGAIQPRKNLETLIEAFEEVQKKQPGLMLVLAGEKAWMWEGVIEKINASICKEKIILTGQVAFEELQILYRRATLFVFPELYAGFGIPVLEAFASNVPVLCANNSSLPEVGGVAALYFDGKNRFELEQKMLEILNNEVLAKKMVHEGNKQLQKFSWEKCAKETLDVLCQIN